MLFDLDGTLIDSEEDYLDSATSLLQSHGLDWDDNARAAAIGCSMATLAELLQSAGLDQPSATIISSVTNYVLDQIQRDVPWRTGAVELVTAAFESAKLTGLVTMSYRSVADLVCQTLPTPNFDVVVTGDDVSVGKPDPEAYLRAAQLLGVEPADCLVFEDSLIGATAARAAGMRTVGVPYYRDLPPGITNTVWPDLHQPHTWF